MSKKDTTGSIEQDNIVNVDFGTTTPNTKEVDAEQEAIQQQYIAMLLNIGQSTYEWAMYATREEYTNHMLELYDHFHPNEEKTSNIIAPKKKIILPN